MLAEGVWTELKAGGEHLRLFSERSPLGAQTSVYNVGTKTWISPSEPVDDIEEGKRKAEAYAKAYLQTLSLQLPPVKWKESRSA